MGKKKKRITSISWSTDKILFLAGEYKNQCYRVWVRQETSISCSPDKILFLPGEKN